MGKSFVGIQLGNSSAKISLYNEKSSNVTVITNEDGDRILPVNAATHHGSEELSFQLNSLAAKSRAISCLYENFFLLFLTLPDQGDSFKWEGDESNLSAKQLCIFYFKKLLEIISHSTGTDQIDSLVLSLSSSLFEKGKERIERLVKENFSSQIKAVFVEGQAKCSLLQFITSSNKSSTPVVENGKNWFVLELGQSASHLNHFYLNESNSNLQIAQLPTTFKFDSFSGKKADLVLHEMVLQEAQRKFKTTEFSGKMIKKLEGHYESTKRTLSQSTHAQIWIESWYDGVDFTATLNRSKYESLLEPHLTKLISELVGIEGMKKSNILVIGSSSKKPSLTAALRKEFPQCCFVGDPDEIASKGASYLAYLIGGNEKRIENLKYSSNRLVLRPKDGSGTEITLLEEGTLLTVTDQQEYKPLSCNLVDGLDYEIIELPIGNVIAIIKSPLPSSSIVIQPVLKEGKLSLKGTRSEDNQTLFDLSLGQ